MFLLPLVLLKNLEGVDPFGRKGLASDRQAPLGVRTHFVEGWLVRPGYLLAISAGLGARVHGGSAGRDWAVGRRSHVVERRLARARSGNGRALRKRWLHGPVGALDARPLQARPIPFLLARGRGPVRMFSTLRGR